RERERHLNLARALRDFERIRQVHRPRDAGEIALELGIAIDPMLDVLVLRRQGFWLVRDLTVVLNDAERSGDAGSRAQRDNRRSGNARVLERVDTRLRDSAGTRGVGLEIPVRFVQR